MAERSDRDGDDLTRHIGDLRYLCEQAGKISWDKIMRGIQQLQEDSRQGHGAYGQEMQSSSRRQHEQLGQMQSNPDYEKQHKLQQENQALNSDLSEMRSEIHRLKSHLEQVGTPNEDIQKAYKKIVREFDQKNKELEQKNKELDDENTHMKTSAQEFEMNYAKTLQKLSQYKAELKNEQTKTKEAQNMRESLSQEVKRLDTELRDTKNRLSKLMSTQVSDNNPDIADLSDKNRPTKLAERYQELYDNQWSDALEALEKSRMFMDEEEIVKYLLQLLQEAKTLCARKAEEQTTQLTRVLFTKETLPEKGSPA